MITFHVMLSLVLVLAMLSASVVVVMVYISLLVVDSTLDETVVAVVFVNDDGDDMMNVLLTSEGSDGTGASCIVSTTIAASSIGVEWCVGGMICGGVDWLIRCDWLIGVV